MVRRGTGLQPSVVQSWAISAASLLHFFLLPHHGHGSARPDEPVNPIGPSLHHQGARFEECLRALPIVDRPNRAFVQVRKLQFDDVAVPHLGFRFAIGLAVQESREHGPKTMACMLAARVISEQPKPLVQRVCRKSPRPWHTRRRTSDSRSISSSPPRCQAPAAREERGAPYPSSFSRWGWSRATTPNRNRTIPHSQFRRA